MDNPKWKTVTINFIAAVVLLFVGGVLNNYLFKDKPGLTYYIVEGDPIETEVGIYYPSSIIINNTGDIPLGSVRVFLKYDAKITKVTSNIYGDKNTDDSLNVRREFRMPKNSFAEIKITSKGKFLETYISSAEIVGTKINIVLNKQ